MHATTIVSIAQDHSPLNPSINSNPEHIPTAHIKRPAKPGTRWLLDDAKFDNLNDLGGDIEQGELVEPNRSDLDQVDCHGSPRF